jgi:hypothetical protein
MQTEKPIGTTVATMTSPVSTRDVATGATTTRIDISIKDTQTEAPLVTLKQDTDTQTDPPTIDLALEEPRLKGLRVSKEKIEHLRNLTSKILSAQLN